MFRSHCYARASHAAAAWKPAAAEATEATEPPPPPPPRRQQPHTAPRTPHAPLGQHSNFSEEKTLVTRVIYRGPRMLDGGIAAPYLIGGRLRKRLES